MRNFQCWWSERNEMSAAQLNILANERKNRKHVPESCLLLFTIRFDIECVAKQLVGELYYTHSRLNHQRTSNCIPHSRIEILEKFSNAINCSSIAFNFLIELNASKGSVVNVCVCLCSTRIWGGLCAHIYEKKDYKPYIYSASSRRLNSNWIDQYTLLRAACIIDWARDIKLRRR